MSCEHTDSQVALRDVSWCASCGTVWPWADRRPGHSASAAMVPTAEWRLRAAVRLAEAYCEFNDAICDSALFGTQDELDELLNKKPCDSCGYYSCTCHSPLRGCPPGCLR